MACADPTSVDGATLVTSSPYADTSVAIFQCTSGYVMSGNPFITCSSGVWTGTYPTCSKVDSNTINLTITDNDTETEDNFPTWLAYVIAAVCGIMALLLIVCIFVWCCHLLGCYEEGKLFGRRRSSGCCSCCRRNSRYSPQQHQYPHCKTYPRRYVYDGNGRRYHVDDLGRPCYYEHKNQGHQNGKVATIATVNQDYQHSEHDSTGTNKMTFVSAVNEVVYEKNQKPAKELQAWKPHANPVRSINTSTK